MASRSRASGFVIVLILGISAIVGALAIAFLVFTTSDQRLQATQNARDEALYAARSGVEYLASAPLTSVPQAPDGARVLAVGSRDRCSFTVDPQTRVITCTGQACDGAGRVLASRRLAVPPNDLEQAYEVP